MITEARVLLVVVVAVLSFAMWLIRRGISQSEERTEKRVEAVTLSLNTVIESHHKLKEALPREYASAEELSQIGKDVGVVKSLVQTHIGFHKGQESARSES